MCVYYCVKRTSTKGGVVECVSMIMCICGFMCVHDCVGKFVFGMVISCVKEDVAPRGAWGGMCPRYCVWI